MPSIIEARGLRKVYSLGLGARKIVALEGLDLAVERGEIFGLVGPNGAGKSTTIKLLLGLIRPTAGGGTVDGHPLGSVESRAHLGYLPETPSLYDFLTPIEFLRVCGRLNQVGGAAIERRAEELLELVGLGHARDLRVRRFSKGMVQRLGLAQALIGDPAVVVLDEPMSGLDPIGRKDVRDVMFRLRDEGRTVFFSTHILPDVEAICDRVALVSKGKLTDIGRLDRLLGSQIRAVEVTVSGLAREQAERIARERAARIRGEGGLIASFPTYEEANRFMSEILAAGGRVEAVAALRENLEELFMRRATEAREARR